MEALRLAELRRWAEDVALRDDPALAAAGRTLRGLLDAVEAATPVDAERLAKIRRRARVATGESNGTDLRERPIAWGDG